MSNLFAQLYGQQNQAFAELLDFGRSSLAVEALSSAQNTTAQALMQSADSQFAQLSNLLPEQNPFESLGINQSMFNGFTHSEILEQTEVARGQLNNSFAEYGLAAQELHNMAIPETQLASSLLAEYDGINSAIKSELGRMLDYHNDTLAHLENALAISLPHKDLISMSSLRNLGLSVANSIPDIHTELSSAMLMANDYIQAISNPNLFEEINRLLDPLASYRPTIEVLLERGWHSEEELTQEEKQGIADIISQMPIKLKAFLIASKYFSKKLLSSLLIAWGIPTKYKNQITNFKTWREVILWIYLLNHSCSNPETNQNSLPKLIKHESDVIVFSKPELETNVVAKIPKNSLIEILENTEKSFKVGFYDESGKYHTGYIHKIITDG